MPRRSSQESSSSQSSSYSSSSGEANEKYMILIKGLTINVSEAHINEIFSKFGTLGQIKMHNIEKTNFNEATVEFLSKQEAQTAVSYMNRGWIDGYRINAQLQEPKQKANANKKQSSRRKLIQKNKGKRRQSGKQHKNKRKNRRRRSSSSSGVSQSDSSSSSSSS